MNTKAFVFLILLFTTIHLSFARSVCDGSTLEIQNHTPYELSLSKINLVRSAKLTMNIGDTIHPNANKLITLRLGSGLDFSGYTRGQLEFSFNEYDILYIYFNFMNTITRTPEFKCQAYKVDAFVSDPSHYTLKVDIDPSKEEQPAHVHIGIYPAT